MNVPSNHVQLQVWKTAHAYNVVIVERAAVSEVRDYTPNSQPQVPWTDCDPANHCVVVTKHAEHAYRVDYNAPSGVASEPEPERAGGRTWRERMRSLRTRLARNRKARKAKTRAIRRRRRSRKC